MRNDKENLIIKLTFKFSIEIIAFSEKLRQLNKFEMASQLFRSGTYIGANIREVQNAESKADFIHKFKIALKECDETDYWLATCENSTNMPSPPKDVREENTEILKIMSKIVSKSKAAI